MGTTKIRQNESWREAPVSELKATVARFEQKIRDAQVASRPTRDTVRRAIRRNWNGRCPAWLKRLSMDIVAKHGDDLADLFCEHPDYVVRRTIDTLARPFGGGLIVAPDNVLTPDLPLENIRAMVEACHER